MKSQHAQSSGSKREPKGQQEEKQAGLHCTRPLTETPLHINQTQEHSNHSRIIKTKGRTEAGHTQERQQEQQRIRMYPYRFSNVLVGYLNLATLLASIPIIGAGLWLAKGSTTTCSSILQTPLLIIGFVVLIVSLAGFVGACFHVAWALWLYLLAIMLLIAMLLGLTAFTFAVTEGGGGTQVPGRPYKEYHTSEYSSWLRNHMQDMKYWQPALACVVGSKACAKIENWTPMDYVQHDLTPIQSGCCKPPTSCQYSGGVPVGTQDEDCYQWNNAPNILCYQCDSCKAGVMEQIRQDWRKVSVLMVIVLVALICICACGCCAFRNARRSVSEYPYGVNRMSKINPRWDYYWWRWWRDTRERLY